MHSRKIIEIQDLKYAYPDGTVALDGVNFTLYENEKVGLIGENGAGKTTFLFHLNGLLKGDGNVMVCGRNARDKNFKEVRQKVGIVFQNPDDQLFCPSIYEDVAFGPRNLGLSEKEVKARVKESLAKIGLQNFEARNTFKISSGEKKRISIATVLAMRPEVLILDEPSSNLDPKRCRQLFDLLLEIGGSQIIASHNLELIQCLCTRVVVFYKGQIVNEGPAHEILNNRNLLEKYGLI